MMKNYPRMVKPGHNPFDPVELAMITEKIVCRDMNGSCERKYDSIHVAGVYGGISTGYAVGCCLRCIFCWSPPSRDFPERYGRFMSPQSVFAELKRNGKKSGVRKCRLSGCEPTLCRNHLFELLELVEDDPYFNVFILETNGILFGNDKVYVRRLTGFSKIYVRVSLKASTPEHFERKTGAIASTFDLPFKAIEYLMEYEIPFHVAAMSLDPRIMNPDERISLALRLAEISPSLLIRLEEEVMDPYKMTLVRLRSAGVNVEWPLRAIYELIRDVYIKIIKKETAGQRR